MGRYHESYPNAKPNEILNWVLSQSPNPWPLVDANILSKLLTRIKRSRSAPEQTVGVRTNIQKSVTQVIYDSKVNQVRKLLTEIPASGREKIVSELVSEGAFDFSGLLSAIKEKLLLVLEQQRS